MHQAVRPNAGNSDKLKRILTKAGIFATGLLLVSCIVFYNLSDLNKAKLCLKVLGLHDQNKVKFGKVKKLIIHSNFEKYQFRDSINSYHIELLEKHLNKGQKVDFDLSNYRSISEVYADQDENWNVSCNPSFEIPNQKFEYLLYSKESMILCTLAGGIGISNWFDFYEIHDGELELVGVINSINEDLFFLALELKFDGDLIEWKSMEENRRNELSN